MASNSEYEQRRCFTEPIIGWHKIGICNAYTEILDNGIRLTFVPHPLMAPKMVQEGIEYFEKLKTK